MIQQRRNQVNLEHPERERLQSQSTLRYLTIFISIIASLNPLVVFIETARGSEKQISTPRQPITDSEKQQTAAKAEKLMSEALKLGFPGAGFPGTSQAQKQAIVKYKEALRLYLQIGDRSGAARTLSMLSSSYSLLKQPLKALAVSNQALKLWQTEHNLERQIGSLRNIADIYKELAQYQKALSVYEQALKIAQSLEVLQSQKNLQVSAYTLNLVLQASILMSIANLYHNNLKQDQRAHQALKQAIDLHKRQLKILQTEAQGLLGYKLDSNRQEQASALSIIGLAYGDLGDRQNALSYLMQSYKLRLSHEKDSKAATRWLEQISNLYVRYGQKQKAIETLNQALKIQQQTQDYAGQVEILRLTAEIYGNLYGALGEPQKALNLYHQALSIQQQIADRLGQVKTLTMIAEIYNNLGDYKLSEDTNEQALRLAEQIGDRKQQAEILANMGRAYKTAGDYKKAATLGQQALTLIRSLKDDRFNRDLQEGTIQLNLSLTYLELHDYPKALTAANQVMELSRKTGFWNGPAYAFNLMGRVYLAQGLYQKALNSFKQALPIFEQNLTPSMDARVLNDMGKAYAGLKQYPKAIETYNSALKQMRKWGDLSGEVKTLYQIALAERDRGNLKAAQTQIESGLAIVEDLRTKVTDPGLRTAYFASVQKYYQLYIDLLMQLHRQQPSQGYNALALQASERSRARNLLELLTEAHADIRQGVDPQLLEQERQLQFKLDALEKRRVELYSKKPTPQQNSVNQKQDTTQQQGSKPTETQVKGIEREQTELLTQYRNLKAEIRAKSPRYAALTQPQPLKIAELQQQVLDDNTLLLEYSLGKERSYLWAVSKSGITSYELPKQAEIEAAIQKFSTVVTNPNARPSEISQAGAPLSRILLGSVAQKLGQKRLLIVSNGVLQYLPFSALLTPTDAQLLLTNHEIINLPSASTLVTLRQELNGRKPSEKAVAIFADPVFSPTDKRVGAKKNSQTNQNSSLQNKIIDLPFSVQTLRNASQDAGVNLERLPGTRKEAEDILKLLSESTRTQAFDFEANRTNVLKSNLSQYRIIHFATHGILNTIRPELSSVVLSLVDQKGQPQNGFLRLHDIFNLNLPAELVVLSACQTGLGQNIHGEGLIGLTRGFMYAGTPRVLVSLWNVNDESTAALMKHFYQAMLEQNLPPAAALRAAQLEMLKHPQWRSPYYWAAFTLQGEWK